VILCNWISYINKVGVVDGILLQNFVATMNH
jgi:hypothetical protein